jgi:hypothetical protein
MEWKQKAIDKINQHFKDQPDPYLEELKQRTDEADHIGLAKKGRPLKDMTQAEVRKMVQQRKRRKRQNQALSRVKPYRCGGCGKMIYYRECVLCSLRKYQLTHSSKMAYAKHK